jgi:hypothetical protein
MEDRSSPTSKSMNIKLLSATIFDLGAVSLDYTLEQ